MIPNTDDPLKELSDRLALRVGDKYKLGRGSPDDVDRKLGFVSHNLAGLRDLVGFLCYSDRAPNLICLDHDLLMTVDAEKTILTLQTLMKIRFDDEPYRIAVEVNAPIDRSWVKTYKSLGVSGLVTPSEQFSYHLSVRCYQELLFGSGECWPKEAVIPTAHTSKSRSPDDCGINLTERQQQVKRLLCERGLSNKAIAKQLNISESTVKIHVSAILKRYAVRNRTQLALASKNQSRL